MLAFANYRLGLGRGSRSSRAETMANDCFLFREREEGTFGIGIVSSFQPLPLRYKKTKRKIRKMLFYPTL